MNESNKRKSITTTPEETRALYRYLKPFIVSKMTEYPLPRHSDDDDCGITFFDHDFLETARLSGFCSTLSAEKSRRLGPEEIRMVYDAINDGLFRMIRESLVREDLTWLSNLISVFDKCRNFLSAAKALPNVPNLYETEQLCEYAV